MGFFSNRRNRIIDQAISSLIASGRTEGDFPNIYYDAARRYAVDNGATAAFDYPDSCSVLKNYGGQDRFIIFSKMWSGGGTSIQQLPPPTFDDILRPANFESPPPEPVSGSLKYVQLEGVANPDVFDAMLEKCVREDCLVRAQSIAPAYFTLAFDRMRLSPHCPPISHYGEKGIVFAGYIASQYGNMIMLTCASKTESFMATIAMDIAGIPEESKAVADEQLGLVFAKWHELVTGQPAPIK